MSHARVRKLFSAALAEWATGKGVPVSYDNVKATFQGADAEHIESHVIPADTFSDTLSGDHKAFIGLFQMTLVTKYGFGLEKPEGWIQELQDIYRINRIFTDADGFKVQVITPIVVPEGKQYGGVWTIPIYFNYRADTN